MEVVSKIEGRENEGGDFRIGRKSKWIKKEMTLPQK